MISAAHYTLIAIETCLLLFAAARDVAVRLIPDTVPLMTCCLGILLRLADGTLILALPLAALVFAAAALCWRRGWLGGGDVKLLGAATLLVTPAAVPGLLLSITLAGGVLALIYLLARPLLSGASPLNAAPNAPRDVPRDVMPARRHALLRRVWRAERWRLRRGGPLPYACAIAAGALFSLSGS